MIQGRHYTAQLPPLKNRSQHHQVMSLKSTLPKALKELRLHLCQTSESSKGLRWVKFSVVLCVANTKGLYCYKLSNHQSFKSRTSNPDTTSSRRSSASFRSIRTWSRVKSYPGQSQLKRRRKQAWFACKFVMLFHQYIIKQNIILLVSSVCLYRSIDAENKRIRSEPS